jgi:hypothetical protein
LIGKRGLRLWLQDRDACQLLLVQTGVLGPLLLKLLQDSRQALLRAELGHQQLQGALIGGERLSHSRKLRLQLSNLLCCSWSVYIRGCANAVLRPHHPCSFASATRTAAAGLCVLSGSGLMTCWCQHLTPLRVLIISRALQDGASRYHEQPCHPPLLQAGKPPVDPDHSQRPSMHHAD